ncbi:MAG: glycerol-3-phosphate 1-O-acyltransferase PlsY [Alphaproteobacteria bacterium]|nr:glycerol-3-phosphate 1-O-acyltransferase PlsY [Alphaproteobacteria bacterium]
MNYGEIIFSYPLIAYLLGSIPFGLILSNLFGNGRLRESGSRNIGATNVLRTQGRFLGFCTFLLDFSKSFIPSYFLANTDNELINLMTISAPVLGHMFPIWLKFKGGKGVATYFGLLAALDIYLFLGTGFVWIVVFAIFRMSSVACLSSIVFSCGLFCYIMNFRHLEFFNRLCVLIFLAIIIFIKHHENIRRLISNKELKL